MVLTSSSKQRIPLARSPLYGSPPHYHLLKQELPIFAHSMQGLFVHGQKLRRCKGFPPRCPLNTVTQAYRVHTKLLSFSPPCVLESVLVSIRLFFPLDLVSCVPLLVARLSLPFCFPPLPPCRAIAKPLTRRFAHVPTHTTPGQHGGCVPDNFRKTSHSTQFPPDCQPITATVHDAHLLFFILFREERLLRRCLHAWDFPPVFF